MKGIIMKKFDITALDVLFYLNLFVIIAAANRPGFFQDPYLICLALSSFVCSCILMGILSANKVMDKE